MHFDESFVIAICFVVFVYIAYRPIKKAINNALNSKINDIKLQLEEAEALKKDAAALLKQAQQEIDSLEEKKQQLLKNAQESTDRMVSSRSKEIELMLERMEKTAHLSIENAKVRASKELSEEFTSKTLKLALSYLKETENNSVSDLQIMKNLKK